VFVLVSDGGSAIVAASERACTRALAPASLPQSDTYLGRLTCGGLPVSVRLVELPIWTVGLFVPKPSTDADYQGCGMPDLGSTGYSVARKSASLADITYQRAWRSLRTSKDSQLGA